MGLVVSLRAWITDYGGEAQTNEPSTQRSTWTCL